MVASESRKAEIRRSIQRAAEKVFREKGYTETKMLDIAREAQMSPSTIYLYFNSKRALFETLKMPEMASVRPSYNRRRDTIIQTALTLFGERGFEGTTMDDIAEELGFSKSALYQYCSGKEDLFLQVLKNYTHANAPSPEDTGIVPEDWRLSVKNVAFSYMALSHDLQRTAFLGSVIRDSNKFPEFGENYYRQSFAVSRQNLVDFLLPFQQRGELRQDADLNTAVTVFFGALTSHIILYNVVRGISCDVPEEDFVQSLCEMFIRGLEVKEEDGGAT